MEFYFYMERSVPSRRRLPTIDLLDKSLTVRGYVLFEITRDPKRLEMAKRFILDGLASGKLKPIIAKRFSGLDQIVEAHRYLESNQQVGRVKRGRKVLKRAHGRNLRRVRVKRPTRRAFTVHVRARTGGRAKHRVTIRLVRRFPAC